MCYNLSKEEIRMSNIYLVTGATGFLGYNVVKKLLENNCRVRVLVQEDDPHVDKLPLECEIFYGDITDSTTMVEFFDAPSYCDIYLIHCAGVITMQSDFDQDSWDVIVLGTKNVLDMCKTYHVKRLIYVSSVHAIPKGENDEVITETEDFDTAKVEGFYSKAKSAATQLVLQQKENINLSIVYPSLMLGPNDYRMGILSSLIKSYIDGEIPGFISGGYDFVDVRDVADAIYNCLENGKRGEGYILSNQYYEVKYIFDITHQISGAKLVKLVIPSWLIKTSSPLINTYYYLTKKKPIYTSYSLDMLNSNANYSHAKATQELDYHPRGIEESIKDTIDFLNENDFLQETGM